jgi:putative FmdB family regulatory protein
VPIYEYRCESCDHRLEKLQKMSEGDLVDCPECKHPALKRLVSASAFRLSGSGWYETDFKKDNKRNLADSPGEHSNTDGSANGAPASSGQETKTSSSDSSVKKTEKPAETKSASKESKNA